jgi:hypothetical protein
MNLRIMEILLYSHEEKLMHNIKGSLPRTKTAKEIKMIGMDQLKLFTNIGNDGAWRLIFLPQESKGRNPQGKSTRKLDQ